MARGAAELSSAHARRIALAAQGFADRRPTGRVDRRHLRRVLDRIGVIQVDSVNVLVRSQELPLFARLGDHPRRLIADAVRAGELFEYWTHMAALTPVGLHPYLRWRMADDHIWRSVQELERRRPGYLDEVFDHVLAEGAVVAADLAQRQGPKGSWWDWDDGKLALELLFHQGRIAAVRRPADFARVYDVAERVIPAEILALPTPAEPDARKELLVQAARHLGVGTLADLADYHRQLMTTCRPLVRELVEDCRLVEVAVEGWDRPAYLHPDATRPRRVAARALLSPFDSLVWYRDRILRLFDFHYRIEIYTPRPKRQFGYYVLPFLLGERLVGRVDLKADRPNGRLLVQGAYTEPGVDPIDTAAELAAELRTMAGWLQLDDVVVGERGDLAPALVSELARA